MVLLLLYRGRAAASAAAVGRRLGVLELLFRQMAAPLDLSGARLRPNGVHAVPTRPRAGRDGRHGGTLSRAFAPSDGPLPLTRGPRIVKVVETSDLQLLSSVGDGTNRDRNSSREKR